MGALKELFSYKWDKQDNLKIKKILKYHENKAITKIMFKKWRIFNKITRN